MLAHCSMRSMSAVDSGDISIHLSSFSRAARSANRNASLSIFMGIVIWRSLIPLRAQIGSNFSPI